MYINLTHKQQKPKQIAALCQKHLDKNFAKYFVTINNMNSIKAKHMPFKKCNKIETQVRAICGNIYLTTTLIKTEKSKPNFFQIL